MVFSCEHSFLSIWQKFPFFETKLGRREKPAAKKELQYPKIYIAEKQFEFWTNNFARKNLLMLHPKPNLIFNLPKSSPFKKIYLCETIQIQFPLKPKRRSCSLNIPLGSILANWFSMYTALGRGGEVGDQIIDSFQIRKYKKWKSSFALRTAQRFYLNCWFLNILYHIIYM